MSIYEENFEDGFEEESSEPMAELAEKEAKAAEIQAAMDHAFDIIAACGPEKWVEEATFPPEKMESILKNMISWFSHEDIEEYEKALLVQRGLKRLQNR